MLWDLFGNFADNPATQFEDTFVVNLVENHFVVIVNSQKPSNYVSIHVTSATKMAVIGVEHATQTIQR